MGRRGISGKTGRWRTWKNCVRALIATSTCGGDRVSARAALLRCRRWLLPRMQIAPHLLVMAHAERHKTPL